MSIANYNFKLLSLNARGIRDFHKRKAIFIWIKKQKVDIAFLQETYSSREIENQWKFQWLGKMLFSHGTTHSKGVLILFSSDLQIDTKNVQGDSEGRYIFVEALVQDTPFLFVNLYAPTERCEQCPFFDRLAEALENMNADPNSQIIIVADLPSYLPNFYKECFTVWCKLSTLSVSTREHVLEQVLWNNQFLRIDGKPVFCKKISSNGIISLGSILTKNGNLKPWNFF